MARPLLVAGEAECAAEAEVGVVVDGVGLDHRLELRGRLLELAVAEVGPAEGLANGALLGRAARGLGKGLRSLLEAAVLEQLEAAPVQRVGGIVGRVLAYGRHPTKCRGASIPLARIKP